MKHNLCDFILKVVLAHLTLNTQMLQISNFDFFLFNQGTSLCCLHEKREWLMQNTFQNWVIQYSFLMRRMFFWYLDEVHFFGRFFLGVRFGEDHNSQLKTLERLILRFCAVFHFTLQSPECTCRVAVVFAWYIVILVRRWLEIWNTVYQWYLILSHGQFIFTLRIWMNL